MKKAQAQFMTQETVSILVRVMAVIILFSMLFAIIKIFTSPKPKEDAQLDLQRIIVEIKDLREGETINVPVFSSGYDFVLRDSNSIHELDLDCSSKEEYCACLTRRRKMYCESFDYDGSIVSNDFQTNRNFGILLSNDGVVTIESG